MKHLLFILCLLMPVASKADTLILYPSGDVYLLVIRDNLVVGVPKLVAQNVTQVVDVKDPSPNPTPNPNPPGPTPTGFPAEVKQALLKVSEEDREQKVWITLPDGNRLQKTCQEVIAANYGEIAQAAKEKPESWGPAVMVNEVKVRNTSSLPPTSLNKWRPFFEGLAQALVGLGLDSSDVEGHVKAFNDISETLSN